MAHAVRDLAQHFYFGIHVVDADTGDPIPGVRLTTIGQVVYTSDANGNVAYYEPGLMNVLTSFDIDAPGYWYPPTPQGRVVVEFSAQEGGSGTLVLTRTGDVAPAADVGTDDTDCLADGGLVPPASGWFGVKVVDAETGRGVPLVTFESGRYRFVTDSNGWIAIATPSLVGTVRTFTITSHGYVYDNAVGDPTEDLAIVPGRSTTLPIRRINSAERLYRATGQGIYRDSILLGLDVPATPAGLVVGMDSAWNTLYQGKLFWTWGDTASPTYSIANFGSTGAVSDLPSNGGLDPQVGVAYRFFTRDDGFVRPLANLCCYIAPTWLGPLVNLKDSSGKETLFAYYYQPMPDGMPLDTGVARYNDATQQFDRIIDTGTRPLPSTGRDFLLRTSGVDYVHLGGYVRFPASTKSIADATAYQTYTPFVKGSASAIDRDGSGAIVYAWKTGTPLLPSDAVSRGIVRADEVVTGQLRDVDTDRRIQDGPNAAIVWNAFLNRFVRLQLEIFGESSFLGEVWYAVADSPMGPWVYARRVVTHDNYSFYNPGIDTYFTKDGGRRLYFEGTYSIFLTNATPTPRYDYNHIMYALNVDRPELQLPVAVYQLPNSLANRFATKSALKSVTADSLTVPFFAMDRPRAGLVAYYTHGYGAGKNVLSTAPVDGTDTLAFHAFPPSATNLPPGAVALYDYAKLGTVNTHVYSTAPALALSGYTRLSTPLAYVWRSPISVGFPVIKYLTQ